MKDLGLSQSLITAVSGIIKTTAKQQQEQSQQQSPSYKQHYGKLGAARPLSMEEAKAATQEAHAPARRVAATIRGMYVKEDVTEAKQKKPETAYSKSTLKTRHTRVGTDAVDEGKAHTVPKTAKEKSLAALAEPKNKITHKDVMVGRGVIAKEETEQQGDQVDEMATSAKAGRAGKDLFKKGKMFSQIAAKAAKKYGSQAAGNAVAGMLLKKKRAAMKEEVDQVEEGWDDMLKAAKERNKPQPNGGAGKKEGTRYGGGKQKDTEEKKEKPEANEEVVDEMMMSSSSTKSSVKMKTSKTDNVGNGLAQQRFNNYIAQRRAENEKNKPQNEEVETVDETSQEYRDAMAAHDSAGREYRLGLAKSRMQQRAAQPKTLGQKIKKDIGEPLIKLAKGDVKGALGESEQIDEISADTATSYLAKRNATHKADLNTPESNPRDVKIAQGKSAASRRMSGAGPDKSELNKVTSRFQYRQTVGKPYTFQKEEMDTPGNSYEHQCAIHVKHSKLGEGRTLFSQHAQPDAEGQIAWYDVMFEHGIEKKVPTTDLEIVEAQWHNDHPYSKSSKKMGIKPKK